MIRTSFTWTILAGLGAGAAPPDASHLAGAMLAGPPPLTRVRAANRAAVREPARDFFAGAVQVYPWTDGALYRRMNPDFSS